MHAGAPADMVHSDVPPSMPPMPRTAALKHCSTGESVRSRAEVRGKLLLNAVSCTRACRAPGQEQCPSAARTHPATAAGRGPAPVSACRSRLRRAFAAAKGFERLEPLLSMPGMPLMSGSNRCAAWMIAALSMAAGKPARGTRVKERQQIGGGGGRGAGAGVTDAASYIADRAANPRASDEPGAPGGLTTRAGREGPGVSCSVAAEVPAAVEQKLTLGFELCGPQLPTAAMPAQLPRRLCTRQIRSHNGAVTFILYTP